MLVVAVVSCGFNHEDYEQAIREYYMQTNLNAGSGTHSSIKVTIESVVKTSDTTQVLAHIRSHYKPPPLPRSKSDEDSEGKLWFLMVEKSNRLEVIGIRDPAKYQP